LLSRETIDKIFSTARVEEIIGEFVQLKRAGSNLKGLSPFVDEKSPSFMISPAKQIWKDFSSGKGGNVVGFLMEHEHFSYAEALRYLAKRYNIEIQEEKELNQEQIQERQQKESLFLVSELANKYFQQQLKETEEGKSIGLTYFRSRGFSEQTIVKFQLGYSPKFKSAFCDFATKKGYKKDVLIASGLCYYNDKNEGIDRFRERVMFPIFSISGRVLGFGARTLSSDKNIAKYLNSPETEIYHKSKVLYGIFQSKSAIIKENHCYLVEGYTDVISLHQNGIENVVASSGTALTEEQIQVIKRLTENITILFDGDSAGIKASFRNIDLLLKKGMNVKVLLFPDGHDPDSFSKAHKTEEIKTFIYENSSDFIRFKTKLLLDEVQNDPVGKANLIHEIVSSIALIDNQIKKELFLKECAKLMDFSEEILRRELATIETINHNQEKKEEQRKQNYSKEITENKPFEVQINENNHTQTVDTILIHEENLIQTILRYGDYIIEMEYQKQEKYKTTVIEEIIHQLTADEIKLTSEFYQKILDDISEGLKNGELRNGFFYTTFSNQEIVQKASDSLFEKHELSKNWEEKSIYIKPKEHYLSRLVKDLILRYKQVSVSSIILSLQKKLSENMEENREEIFKKIIQLTHLKNAINLELNRIV
jgi:DNA primase